LTLMVQVFPAASARPLLQAPVVTFWKKSPLTVRPVIFSVAFPELVRVTVFTEASLPTIVLGNTSEVGLNFTFAPLMVMLTVVVWVKVPDVPVMVTTLVPAAAEELAVRVRVLVVVAGFGLNAAVTPAGRFDAVRLTPLLKPFAGVTVITLVPLLPGGTVTLLGEAVIAKSGPTTVRPTVVVCVMLPDLPVMVRVEVPVVAVAPTLMVKVLVVAVDVGLNEAVTPLGMPATVNATLPVNPFRGNTEMVLVPDLLNGIVTLLGLAPRA